MGEINGSVVKTIVASAVMGLAVWWAASFGEWQLGGNDPKNLIVFAVTAVAGLLVYLGTAAVLRAPELVDLQNALRRRMRA